MYALMLCMINPKSDVNIVSLRNVAEKGCFQTAVHDCNCSRLTNLFIFLIATELQCKNSTIGTFVPILWLLAYRYTLHTTKFPFNNMYNLNNSFSKIIVPVAMWLLNLFVPITCLFYSKEKVDVNKLMRLKI